MEKKKRIRIIFGVIGGLFVLMLVMGAVSSGKRAEYFAANKEQIVGDLRAALDSEELAKCEVIVDEYRYIDDHDMKLLVAEYDEVQKAAKEARKKAEEQAAIAAQYVQVNEPFAGEVLEVKVTNIEITDRVGGVLLNESSQGGVLYFVVKYTYKNISKSPTHETPTISLVSPDGARYSADVSASVYAAGASEEYDVELLSELQPQVHSNDLEVFKVPQNMGEEDGWKVEITIEDGGFYSGVTKSIPLKR